MTTICAIQDINNNCVWIGSDSQVTGSGMKSEVRGKWIKHKNWAIGVSGNLRTINILDTEWNRIVEEHKEIYAITRKLREVLKDDGIKTKESDGDFPLLSQYFLITDGKKIWDVGSDMAFKEANDSGFMANGSGFHFAYGAFHALSQSNRLTRMQIMARSIEAACFYDAYSGGKVFVDKVLPIKKK